MADVLIQAEGLGKRYVIGHQAQRERYTALRDVIARRAKTFVRMASDLVHGRAVIEGDELEEVWALRDVSFEVKRGEVLGIIGRNGAGKSTLLKILSRITEPTTGRVLLRGRVASLLEVGTGFHLELTGRENIFLNGAILGMKRAEIRARFDEIVAFAEVEKFLDTPVKRYSSGMYVRLAFAVAAHLEPEILIVDEVLAVGDAEFQKRCLGKMEEVADREGRTVLFVSHNMSAINRLCRSAMLLDAGRIQVSGETHLVTSRYLAGDDGTSALRRWDNPAQRPGDGVARLVSVGILQEGRHAQTIDIRLPVVVEMVYDVLTPGRRLVASCAFFDSMGTHLFAAADFAERIWDQPRPPGRYKATCTVPGNLFAEGEVRVTPEVSTRSPVYEIHFLVFDSVAFQVVDKGEAGSVRAGWGRPIPGVMRPMCGWETRPEAMASGEGEQVAAGREI